jgi:hypothetical protein
MGPPRDRKPDDEDVPGRNDRHDDEEEQSALELLWALRTTPLTPRGRHPSGHGLPGTDNLGPAARQLQDEIDERRRLLVELLAGHLGSGAMTVPAILSLLSKEERDRMNELLGGRTIAEVLGTTDLFHLGLG